MSRIRRRTAGAPTPWERPPLPRKRDIVQSGRGAFADAYPLPGDAADHRAILAAQLSRDMLLAADPEWWAGDDEG